MLLMNILPKFLRKRKKKDIYNEEDCLNEEIVSDKNSTDNYSVKIKKVIVKKIKIK